MKFVQREGGVVKGVYANRQPGYAEEELPDDHPDIVAFNAPKALEEKLTVEDLAIALLGKGILSTADIDAAQGSK